MRFRPCIDLHNGKVKQIVGSTLSGRDEELKTNFETTLPSSHYAALYKRDGLYGGHVIMLGPGNEKAALDALQGFPGGLQVGGGITPVNAGKYLDAGASHVIVTSYVFNDGQILWDRLNELEAAVGKGRLVLDLSCKKIDDTYKIVTDRWQKISNEVITAALLGKLHGHCSEFLVHAAHVEGMRSGVDEALIELLTAISPITTTYAGGVRSFEDLAIVNQRGCGRIDVTIGSALDLFGGNLSYRDVVQWMNAQASNSSNR